MRVQLALWLCLAISCRARAETGNPSSGPIRIFTVGNSFINWLPSSLKEVEALADVKDHVQVGASFIGGSQIIDHWVVPDGRNQAKAALMAGSVDVLTLGGRLAPDEGIANFLGLGLARNPNLRVTVQDIWLPYDRLDRFSDGVASYGEQAKRLRDWSDPPPASTDPQAFGRDTSLYDVPTASQVGQLHAVYFDNMDRYVAEQNRKLGRQALFVVPVGQAVIALRKMVSEGEVPEIPRQSDLFADRLGHPKAVIRALSAYCHFAVIYNRSPVGLPLLPSLARDQYSAGLNRLLQELAWDTVVGHPLSGVSRAGTGK